MSELALDFEAFMGRALPALPHHKLQGTRLPLGERAHVPRQAAWLVQPHVATGQLLWGAPTYRCCSLLPLGGRFC